MSRMITDANCFAHYYFDEASGTTLADSSGNGRDMTLVGSPTVIAGLNGNARTFNGTTQYAEVISDANWRTLFGAAWTIEAWIKQPVATGGTSRMYLFSNAGSFSGETLADNCLAAVINSPCGGYGVFWENGAGVNGIDQFSANCAVGQGQWAHMAWRRNAASGGSAVVEIFVDGRKIVTYSAATVAAGGTSAAQYNHIARFYRDNSGSSWSGTIDELRISNIARSDAEILESYTRGIGGGTGAPTLSNLSPADGQRIAPSQAISFDVTCADAAGLAQTLVWVTYASGLVELACEGTSFTPPFRGESTTVAISNGYTYSLKRRGGFPLAPRISISAINYGGLEL